MYKIKFDKNVDNDLEKLDNTIRNQVFLKLQKISLNPELWQNLSWNLAWCKKVYVHNKQIRIVYKINKKEIEILVIAIWKRDNKQVYKDAFWRV